MSTNTETKNVHPAWIAGLIIAAVLAVLFGVFVGMFLLIGIAMGGDAVGSAYANWATVALIAYPVTALAIIVASLIWGIVAKSDSRRVIALILIAAAVPIAAVIALALTQIGISLA